MCAQDGMQNQVNINPESHYIIPAGGLVNLSELVTTTKTTAGKQHTCIHQLCLGAVIKCRNEVTQMNKQQMDGMWNSSLCRWGKRETSGDLLCYLKGHMIISDNKQETPGQDTI